MRFDHLTLHSFGVHQGTSLDLSEPDAGIVVVVGPNEAGKSTSLRALTSFLFGIPRGSGDHLGRGRDSLRIGAGVLSAAGEKYDLVRQTLVSKPLVDADGAVFDVTMLDGLLGNIDARTFEILFCIGHQELVDNSKQLLDTEGELGRLVFGASLGATTLSEVQARLQNRAGDLYKPSGSLPIVNKRLKDRDDLLRRAKDATTRANVWGALDDERARVEAEAAEVTAVLNTERATKSRLERIQRSIPRLLTIAADQTELAQIEASGPVPGTEWADAVDEALAKLSEAVGDIERERITCTQLDTQIAAIEVDEALLDRSADVGKLTQDVGRYTNGEEDLPELRLKLSGADAEIADQLERLGAAPDDDTYGRSVTDGHIATITSLVEQHTRLDGERANARDERDRVVAGLGEERARLDGRTEVPDLTELERAHGVATSLVEVDKANISKRADLDADRRNALAAAARISLGERAPEEIEMLAAPSRAVIDAHRQTAERLNRRLAELRDVIERKERELGETKRSLTAPDADALRRARAEREGSWRQLRATIVEQRPDVPTPADAGRLADAYEATVVAADGVVDERYVAAEALAVVERIETELAEYRGELATTEADRDAWSTSWSALWADVAVVPDGPEQMLEWRSTFDEVCSALAQHRRNEAALTPEITRVDEALADLTGALTGARAGAVAAQDAPVATGMSLTEAIAAARILLDDAAKMRLIVDQIARLESELTGRDRTLEAAEQKLHAWADQWRDALLPLGLDGTTSVAEADAVCTGIKNLRELRRHRGELETRVKGLERDITEFQRRVHEFATALAPDLVDRSPDDIALEIGRRLGASEKANGRRELLQQQREDADAKRVGAETGRAAAEAEVRRLVSEAGLPDDADPVTVADRARDAARLRNAIATTEAELGSLEGGLPLETLRDEASEWDLDPDRVQAAIADDPDRIAGLEHRVGELREHLGEVQEQMRAVDGSSAAADLEQEATDALSEAVQAAREWVCHQVAIEVLDRAIAEFSERHQQPILKRAEQAFTLMTGGAFRSLEIDIQGASQIVLAERRNGERLRIEQLSDGTRDQLYLSLRLAGVQHHLDALQEPLPVILDDLLVNFDDDRTASALEVLAELGTRTQVILFTHLPRDAAIAQRVLGDRCRVVELDARDHDTAPIAAAPSMPTAAAAPPIPVAAAGLGGDAVELVKSCLAASIDPLPRTEIMRRTGLSDGASRSAVKALVEEGTVVQEGVKRGAKYRLA